MRERGAGRKARLIPPVGGAARRFPLPFGSPERKRGGKKEKREEKEERGEGEEEEGGGHYNGRGQLRALPRRSPGPAPRPGCGTWRRGREGSRGGRPEAAPPPPAEAVRERRVRGLRRPRRPPLNAQASGRSGRSRGREAAAVGKGGEEK